MRAEERFDYVVAGAGPAGCAVAGRLADRGARVLLLEAGPRPWHPLLSVPLAAWFAMSMPRFHRSERSDPVALLNGRRLSLLSGQVLGGGGAINGMIFLRGGPVDYDRWRDEAGCAGWGYADVLPWLLRFEASARGADPMHGGAGPIRTTPQPRTMELAQRFLAAAVETGLPFADDLNTVSGEAAGWFDTMSGSGVRSLPGKAYLSKALRTGRLAMVTRATVMRVDIDKGVARGVTYLHGGRERQVVAGEEVILCAGALRTPHVLQLSGIGPAADLAAAGIKPILDRAQVGANLQNHLAYSLDYACPRELTFARYLDPVQAAFAALRYTWDRSGVFAGAPCPAGALLQVERDAAGADTQLIFGGGLPPASGLHGFRLMVNHGRPRSRGRVTLQTSDPLAPPRLDAGWTEPDDLALLTSATARAREIASRGPLAEVVTRELRPGSEFRGSAGLAEAVRRGAFSYYHPVGTCRMGPDSEAVVDLALRVNGVDRLRVADNSIIPLQINGNTAACALMIGERAAAFISGEVTPPPV